MSYTLDVKETEGLRHLAWARPEFLDFFKHLSSRQRNRGTLDLDTLLDNVPDNGRPSHEMRRLGIEFFKELDKLDLGEFRIGRRGKPTRFNWSVPMVEVGQAVVPNEIASGEIESNDDSWIDQGEIKVESSVRPLAHKYILRPSFAVVFDLPIDLTTKEAERLASFIRTLPLEEN